MEQIVGVSIDQAKDPEPRLDVRMRCVGWLWRAHPHTNKWIFTMNLSNRSYPSTSEFRPVYVEESW